MGRHNQVTPHLARYARHPLPKGEGCVSTLAGQDRCAVIPTQSGAKGRNLALIPSSACPPLIGLELWSASAQSEIPLPRLRDRNDSLQGFFRSLFSTQG